MEERKLLCDRCRKFVPVKDIRYTSYENNKKIALCTECRARNIVPKKISTIKPEKEEYLCTRCKYKFKHNKNSLTNLLCPFCGKADRIIPDKAHTADELVKAAEDYEEFFRLG